MVSGESKPAVGVRSVGKAFDVLEAFLSADGPLNLSELAELSGQPMASVHRQVRTLVDRGYLRPVASRRYTLGHQLVPLGQLAQRAVGGTSRHRLDQLVMTFQETVNLAVLDGDHVVYVGQSPSPHSVRMFTEIGRRALPHCTGVGKALLAQMPDDAIRELLDRTGQPSMTPSTITTPETFMEEIRRVRAQGYAIDEEEMEPGVRCIAVAVPDLHLRLAVSMSGPASRMTDALIEQALPALRSTAIELANDLTSSA
jgi:IclR family acetate operon transcriptional repressor